MPAKIIDRVELGGEAGSIALYDWMADEIKYGRNLMRLDVDGAVVWTASPPGSGANDCFTYIDWDGRALTANTWSCYRVSVNLETGDVTVLSFTK